MKFDVFLKGILMGVCDLIPGISGGTIAFITGIYERLIRSVSNVLNFSALYSMLVVSFSFNFKKIDRVYKKYDVYFLFTLLLGILVAILLGSRVVVYLLDHYFVFTMSFFIGLIVASSILIYKKIDDHKVIDRLFGVLGFFVGFLILFLVPSSSVSVSLFYVLISGFVGISAMFLPGISGAYILYLLGSYESILRAVGNFDLDVLLVFLVGAVLGAVFISKIISYLLRNYHSKTLYVLFGFVLGALFVPLRDIYVIGFAGFDLMISILLFFIGFLVVLVAERIA